MAHTLNRFQGIGNLGRDPEIRSTQSGDRIANLSVGCSDSWTDKSGQRQDRTYWARVVVFGRQVDAIEKYLRKGDRIYVEGRLSERKWQDKSGNDRYSTEVTIDNFNGTIQFLTQRPEGAASASTSRPASADPRYNATAGGGSPGSMSDRWSAGTPDLDDNIPFAACVD